MAEKRAEPRIQGEVISQCLQPVSFNKILFKERNSDAPTAIMKSAFM
jgi:hypothetical protein